MESFKDWRKQKWRDGVSLPDFREMMDKWSVGHSYEDSGTIEEFSRAYGIPRRSVHNWLSGARKPPDYLLWLLAYAMESDDFKPPNWKYY